MCFGYSIIALILHFLAKLSNTDYQIFVFQSERRETNILICTSNVFHWVINNQKLLYFSTHRYLNTTQLFCNCKLSWLPVWLLRKGFKYYVRALCLHPKPLERRSIFNLTSSDFVCGRLSLPYRLHVVYFCALSGTVR